MLMGFQDSQVVRKIIVWIHVSKLDICLLLHQVRLNKPRSNENALQKEQCCLKKTMAFKYRLFQPCDSLHFSDTCPNPESKCKKQRQNHRSPSLLCYVCFQMERMGIQENISDPA